MMTVAMVAAGMLSSCHIYNKYQLPADNAVINDYSNAVAQTPDSTSLPYLGWRQVFTDPVLQGYISQALDKNVDLANAKLNVDIANAQVKGARLSYLPSLSLTPNGGSASYGGSHMNWSYSIPLAASWEVDVFGKILNRKRGAEMSRDMAGDYRQAAQSQIIGAVANCYYTIVMLNQQLDLTRRTAVIWEDQVKSMKLMKEAALTNQAAVDQAEANYYSIMASIPDLENSLHQTHNALSLLLRTYPQTWAVTSSMEFSMPVDIEKGVPMAYLATRPDVRAAERNFAVAYYSTNSARAAFYPSIVISAQGGFTNLLGSIITNPGKWFIQLAGQLTAPIFSRGQNIATLEAAKAQQQIALNNFQYSVLNASAEVSNAYCQIRTATAKREQLIKEAEAYQALVEHTQVLFTTSDASYLELLQARTGLLNAQMSALACWYDRVSGYIYLYQTVGGGR